VKANRIGVASLTLGVLVVGSLGACGGSRKGAEDPSAAEPDSKQTWQEKSREQRMDWMGLEVFPKMRAAFVEFDAKEYSAFACQTCHGNDMEMVDFKMPNKLYSLNKADPVTDAKEYDEETTQLMVDVVVPEMAKLLDMEPYDPETQKGFGCFGCHPTSD
jgi:cytochrome c553